MNYLVTLRAMKIANETPEGGQRYDAALPQALKMFGARDAAARARWDSMMAAGFEKKGGFDSEAVQEASRRVLFDNPSTLRPGNAPVRAAGDERAGLFNRLRVGKSVFDTFGTGTTDSATGEGRTGKPAGGRRSLTAEVESQRTLPDRSVEVLFKPLIISDGLSSSLGAFS